MTVTTLLAFPDGPHRNSSLTASPTTTTSGRPARDRSATPARRRTPGRQADSTGARGPGVDRAAPLTPVPVESVAERVIRVWGLDRYRRELGWPVGEHEGSVVLRLGEGIGAVEFPAGRGRDVVALLRARRLLGPVLALPGRQLRWVFLTTPDDPGDDTGHTPPAGARIHSAATLALPPATTPRGPVRWIVAPPGGPLPRLSAVVAAGWHTVTLR